jgi:hypothetical protein
MNTDTENLKLSDNTVTIEQWKSNQEFNTKTKELKDDLENAKIRLLKSFDYNSLYKMMKASNWIWTASKTKTGVPSIEEIKECAEELLSSVIDRYIEKREDNNIEFPYIDEVATGGFEIELWAMTKVESPRIKLKFVIKSETYGY